jgi:hypothetical protein
MDVDRRLYNLHRLYHSPNNPRVSCAFCRRIRTLNYGRYANFRNVLGNLPDRQPQAYPVLPNINQETYTPSQLPDIPNSRLPRIISNNINQYQNPNQRPLGQVNHRSQNVINDINVSWDSNNRNRNRNYRYPVALPSIDFLDDVEVQTNLSLINNSSDIEVFKGDTDDICVICYDNFKENDIVRKLKCEHIFHQKCCDKWFETHKKCPICNKSLDS